MKRLDLWFSIGSTYTYLTVMRIDALAREHDITVDWHPFSVSALMQEMNNIPFRGKPVKEKYMWRDLERRAALYSIPVQVPVEYPLQHFDLANRIAIVAEQEGWCRQYAEAAYRLWFQEGLPAGDEANLRGSLAAAGQDCDRVLSVANAEATVRAYDAATSQARKPGVFGSPSFLVGGGELFWGDDRLEDALEFARPGGD
jgi:2-hydroxychromene-2-carboxylate isomerase